MKLLVALCAELQIAVGQGTFFLSCRDAGDLLDQDFRTVSRWLKKLEFDGVLKRIATGSRGSHKANEYRFSSEGI
jgi:DNA-binding Lrp family transcriptional regulator